MEIQKDKNEKKKTNKFYKIGGVEVLTLNWNLVGKELKKRT